MSDARESMPTWTINPLRPDLSVLPMAYRGSRQAETLTVEIQAPSGSWFPLPPPADRDAWTTDADGLRELALALALTRRSWYEAIEICIDLSHHLEPIVLRSHGWQLTPRAFERMLAIAAYDAGGDVDQADPRLDRSTLFIESLKSDRETVVKLFGDPEEEYPSTSGPAAEVLVFSQVNYGGRDGLACLASKGIAFSARHEDGDDYHGMTFAACEGTFAEIASPRGQLMVGVDAKTLVPDALDLENLRLWRETEDRVCALFAAAAKPSNA